MIQKSERKSGIPDEHIEEFFSNVIEDLKIPELNKDNSEYDMTKKYIPTWACIWNKIPNIGKECIIDIKDDRLALVAFNGIIRTNDNVVSHLYRLEDLSLK